MAKQRLIEGPKSAASKGGASKGGAAKRGAANSGAAPAKSNALMWIQGLLCGGLVAMLPPTALLLGVLLGPALLGLFLDSQPGKPIARSVLLCSLAASVKPVRLLWAAGHSMAVSMALATDADVVGTAWAGAAAGWLLAELLPVAVRVVLEAVSLRQAARLRTVRAALAEEWGLDAGNQPPTPPS
jgi:hypothetical protein